MGLNYPMLIGGAVVIVLGILIVIFHTKLVHAMARFQDFGARAAGEKPEDHPPLWRVTNGSTIVWGTCMSCAGVLLILNGVFRWA